MNIDIEVSGRIRRVELERGPAEGGACAGSIDGRVVSIDAVRTAAGWSLLIDGASFEATVDGATVYVNGQAVPVRVLDPRAYRRRVRGQAGGATGGPVEVRAPMPGRVVKLLVQIGERVAARQGVVVVEAMKMENELRAPRDGVIRDVRAHEGASVDAGAILVIIE
ncbi:MAG TPA: acetyl-CoA carboxylase biotin carboxyl carrier protein subunit [Vicinamibacterales bacterium]|nr:acetyl-CoA carboxylase biotin carboxyl carrier protein subunit [Vicinamibacterales bacterium]